MLNWRFNRRSYIFLVCLVISTSIWFLIALSKNYTTIISFPVKYINLPEDQVVVNQLTDRVSLEVTSHGFSLLSYKLFQSNKTIMIDASTFRQRRSGEVAKTYITTRTLFDRISLQLGNETKVSQILPDTIYINYSEKMTKTVLIRPDVTLNFKQQFMLAGEVDVRPPVVDITGPKILLDTMESIATYPLVFEALDEDVTQRIGYHMKSKIKDITYSPQSAIVNIPVDEFTEGVKKAPIEVRNVPSGTVVKTFPDSIAVSYLVGLKSYNKVRTDMFRAVVELPDSSEWANTTRLKVKLLNYPSFIEEVSFSPEKVEFIIR